MAEQEILITKGNEHPEERIPSYKPTEKIMTKRELRERLARVLEYWCIVAQNEPHQITQKRQLIRADQILDLVEEAGYVEPPDSMEITELAEIIYNFKMDIKTIKSNIQSFLLANHYVKLAEDQTFPPPNFKGIHRYSDNAIDVAFRNAYRDMLKEDWRRVILGDRIEED